MAAPAADAPHDDAPPTDASDDEGAASTATSSTPSPSPTPTPTPHADSPWTALTLTSTSTSSSGVAAPVAGCGAPASARRGPGRPRKEPTRPPRHPRRFRNPLGSMRGFKRHRGSRDDSIEDLYDDPEMFLGVPEEPPYFPEKWPGKVCALCNLSQRSQLGQGEMTRVVCDVSGGVSPAISIPSLSPTTPTFTTPPNALTNAFNLTLSTGRRQKNINKCKTPFSSQEHTDEFSVIGYSETAELSAAIDGGYLYLHKACLDWSPPAEMSSSSPLNENEKLIKSEDDAIMDSNNSIKTMVAFALQRKCSFCLKYGASISCRMSCTKYFHYPCVLASGGFQEITNHSSFCREHIYQVPLVCSVDIECHSCGSVGDLANLMTCCTCNAHYHGTCVGLPQLPGVRAGWNCKQCRVCQVCHGVGTDSGDSRAIACEQCDKLYHATCIRPIMTTIPKYGWKCKCCRVCSDCGSRSPGAGASSRWHSHYTVCDSCYQQRNKGLSCPLCRRAYRAAAQREMVQCSNCKRYVHGSCDADADLITYQQKKDMIPEYEYVCPVCKSIGRTPLQRRKDSIDDENLSASQETLCDESATEQDPLNYEMKCDIGLGKGKPYNVSKLAKKKIGLYKFKSGLCNISGKLNFSKKQRGYFMEFGRKRGTKTKMRGLFGIPGLGLQKPQSTDNKSAEEEPGVENRLVLCSSKDKFVLSQDLCVMCGALGIDSEGCLIACAQCGQTYHPYCVSVKITSVIIQKGWRCLDCTACEGCGRRDDEARLVLCDDCDVSYHTYCARPPLTSVPRGCWRCARCRQCITCGTTQPGPDNMWMNGYTECGPCASLVMCAACGTPYNDSELIIQCTQCRRWLHATCDSIHSEQEADICCQRSYTCLLCRPRDCPPPHLEPTSSPIPLLSMSSLHTGSMSIRPPSPGEFFLDGVCLSAGGLRAMRALQGNDNSLMNSLHGRKKRRSRFDGTFDKNAGILATIESVVQGDVSNDDMKMDCNSDIKDEQGISPYKEGMIWIVAQDGPPPDGFTTYTTESGTTVLRRKRQRNLNKVGIGGFTVRIRSQTRTNRGCEETFSAELSETLTGNSGSPTLCGMNLEKRKKPRRKPRSRLMESFPSYMQEAFFGRELLDVPNVRQTNENEFLVPMTDSDSEDITETKFLSTEKACTIRLNQEELMAIELTKVKEEKEKSNEKVTEFSDNIDSTKTDNSLQEHFKDLQKQDDKAILNNQSNSSHPNSENILSEKDQKSTNILSEHIKKERLSQPTPSETNISGKELSLLGMNLETMVRDSLPNMDSHDVEELFKGVLTDDSQESQESSVSFVNSVSGSSSYNPQKQLPSPMEYPSPYHTEYSGSSQLSPAFSESSSHWSAGGVTMNSSCVQGVSDVLCTDSNISQPLPSQTIQPSTSQRSTEKMKADESLGPAATISAVLYANLNHPEWKTEFPNWPDRCKQILKKWRALASDKKTPYLQQARDNRGAIRMKKAQAISKENAGVGSQSVPDSATSTIAAELPATLPDQSAEVPLEKDGLNLTHASATNTSPASLPLSPSPNFNTTIVTSSPITTNTSTCSNSVVSGLISSNFNIHHQFMPFFHGTNGPAPNVTVNPFGKFTTTGNINHKLIGRNVTPNSVGPHLTLGIVQQAQTQLSTPSIMRHNLTGTLFSQTINFLEKNHSVSPNINTLVQNGGGITSKLSSENISESNSTVKSRSSSPVSPVGDTVSDSVPSIPSTPASAPSSPSGDLHIRVLTPSEIMRTLPSMPQELIYESSNQVTVPSSTILNAACIAINVLFFILLPI